ncbi:MAG: ABC transporter ATP-binding protein [Chloroflexi bacterium]|nr:MAG: ABC transporter ATP-binding protein [Chloroflexota bacterium]
MTCQKSMNPTVITHALHKSFENQPIVVDCGFQVMPGNILALLGPSGCGKTTTLRLIAGFEQLDSGSIEIDGQLVANPPLHVPPERRRAGMVFQDYAIFPHLSVADNVRFGLGKGKTAVTRTADMLDFVGLGDSSDKMPHELSGGMQQRVALARALAPNPSVLLLDEPFSNLDAALRVEVRAEVKQLLKTSGTTAIFVTHDQEEALYLGDEVAVMHNGRIEQIAAPEIIFHQPSTRFVAEFVGHTDFLDGHVQENGIATSLGLLHQESELAAGTAVSIMLRADDVHIVPNVGGNGRILDRQFVGIAYVYRVGLADGTVLHSWQSHTVNLGMGTAVNVSFNDDHELVVFHKDIA